MVNNKRGSAMLQVLVMGAVIAAIITIVLRFSTIRTIGYNRTRREVVTRAVAEACIAQYNTHATHAEIRGVKPNPSGIFSCYIPMRINNNLTDITIHPTIEQQPDGSVKLTIDAQDMEFIQ